MLKTATLFSALVLAASLSAGGALAASKKGAVSAASIEDLSAKCLQQVDQVRPRGGDGAEQVRLGLWRNCVRNGGTLPRTR
jgi:hypothetical protein